MCLLGTWFCWLLLVTWVVTYDNIIINNILKLTRVIMISLCPYQYDNHITPSCWYYEFDIVPNPIVLN